MSMPGPTNRTVVMLWQSLIILCSGRYLHLKCSFLKLSQVSRHKYLNCIRLDGPSIYNNYVEHMSTLRQFLTLKHMIDHSPYLNLYLLKLFKISDKGICTVYN